VEINFTVENMLGTEINWEYPTLFFSRYASPCSDLPSMNLKDVFIKWYVLNDDKTEHVIKILRCLVHDCILGTFSFHWLQNYLQNLTVNCCVNKIDKTIFP
jgi:hypothetical protein